VLESRLAPAAITVDSVGDNVAADGKVTLREAILSINAGKNISDVVAVGAYGTDDTILFNIPGAGVKTIAPSKALPGLSKPVTIDGYSQPGSKANTQSVGSDAVLLIELDGTNAGALSGLRINGGNSTVQGLVINRFSSSGILIGGQGGNKIQGNYIGTDPAGGAARNNKLNGITILLSDNNLIGGGTPAARNLISCNDVAGIRIQDANGNKVRGNYIGTDKAGNVALGAPLQVNAFGVEISGSSRQNSIGGPFPQQRNLISGNGSYGVWITASQNEVAGNFIGTKANGTQPLPNGEGVRIEGANNTIGGTTEDLPRGIRSGNVISGNDGNGVEIAGMTASGNLVQGNYIGLDRTGGTKLPNGQNGVYITDAPLNQIGGPFRSEDPERPRNYISGNSKSGVVITGENALGNKIQGNYIGLDRAGTAARPNGLNGVHILSKASLNLVGGSSANGNFISGNKADGVRIEGSDSVLNLIQSNLIGLDSDGDPLGNDDNGVKIDNARNTVVGGAQPGQRNVISANGVRPSGGLNGSGVYITGANATGNQLLGNHIGTDFTGTKILNAGGVSYGNQNHGVALDAGAPGNQIGGLGAGEGNVISGNSKDGIHLNAVARTKVYGNFVGTDRTGKRDLGNGGVGLRGGVGHDLQNNNIRMTIFAFNRAGGISLESGSDNVVEGDVVFSNRGPGVSLLGDVSGTLLQDDLIGTDAEENPAGNSGPGVFVDAPASNNVLQGDLIAFNAGGLVNLGTLSAVQDSMIRDNSTDRGGGVFNSGSLSVTDSWVGSNSATAGGGGIANEGTLTLLRTSVYDNRASEGGGLANAATSDLSVTDSFVFGNTTAEQGGGLANQGELTVLRTNAFRNDAGSAGGGLANAAGGDLHVTDSGVANNMAACNGGGIANEGMLTVVGCSVLLNGAGGDGGGIDNTGTGTLSTTDVLANRAGGRGGGVENAGELNVIVNCLVCSNVAGDGGGGICNETDSTLTVSDSRVVSNQAGTDGGGIANVGTLSVTASTITGNVAEGDGGGIFNGPTGYGVITGTTLSGNSAGGSGDEYFNVPPGILIFA
jgi:hypothetical protein